MRETLVGRCFVWFGEDNEPQTQGIVIADFGEDILVQYFDFIMGDESTLSLVRREAFLSDNPDSSRKIILFVDPDHLRSWFEHGAGKRFLVE